MKSTVKISTHRFGDITGPETDFGLIRVESVTNEYEDHKTTQHIVIASVGSTVRILKKRWIFKQILTDYADVEKVISHLQAFNTVRGLRL